jgi:hypothetical protein
MTAVQAETHCVEFEKVFSLELDVPGIYSEWKSLVTQHAVLGKGAHDARIVAAMKAHNVSHSINEMPFVVRPSDGSL